MLRQFLDFFKDNDQQAVVNGSIKLTVPAGCNLLQAALQQGYAWPHDCRVGSCGTCRCRIKKGRIKPLTDFSYVLSDDEMDAGMVLACQSRLKTAIEVEVELEKSDTEEVQNSPVLTVPAQIKRTTALTHDIQKVVVELEEDLPSEVVIRSGQYAELACEGLEKPRSYSFAKSPKRENPKELTFFIRHVVGGIFTDWLFESERAGTPIKVTLPFGSFALHSSDTTMVLIAGGSGMSGIKAILETAAYEDGCARDAYLLFGARTQQDLYCRQEMREISANWHQSFKFRHIEVLSAEPEGSDWKGPTGFVTDYLLNSLVTPGLLNLDSCQIYMCGPPPMIDAAIEVAKGAGASEKEIFFDKFLDASTLPQGGR